MMSWLEILWIQGDLHKLCTIFGYSVRLAVEKAHCECTVTFRPKIWSRAQDPTGNETQFYMFTLLYRLVVSAFTNH